MVTREDIRAAARLALPHRRRRNPFDAPGLDEGQLDDALGDPDDERPEPTDPDPEPEPPEGGGRGPQGRAVRTAGRRPGLRSRPTTAARTRAGDGRGEAPAGPGSAGAGAPGRESVAPSGATFRARRLEVPGKGQGAAGRRSRAATDAGRSTGARPPQPGAMTADVHLAATLTASAPHQRRRGRSGPGLLLEAADLREHRREGRESNLVLFAVDASGSMAARRRMEAVKGAVLSLLLDAYQRRDKVGLVCFRGAGAELLLPPTSSVDAAARRLAALPSGGRTPLAAGLAEAHATLRRERLRDPRRRPLLVVVTDGRHTAGPAPAAAAAVLRADGIASVVIDCESGPVRLGPGGRAGAGAGRRVPGPRRPGRRVPPGRRGARGEAGPGLSAELLAGSVRGWRAVQDGRKVA